MDKIEIIINNGKVEKLIVKEVRGKGPLSNAQLKDFKELVELLADEIVQSWVNYFVYHKKIVPKKIQGKWK